MTAGGGGGSTGEPSEGVNRLQGRKGWGGFTKIYCLFSERGVLRFRSEFKRRGTDTRQRSVRGLIRGETPRVCKKQITKEIRGNGGV